MSDNDKIHIRAEVTHGVSKIRRLDVYGNPSEELRKVLSGTQTFNRFAGFSP